MNDQFRAAVAAVYGNDPAQRQAANLWLDGFSKTPEAWGCALALLESTSGASVEQRFFAANLLASKTRSDWGGLNPQHRSQLADAFGALLRGMLLAPAGTSSPAAAAFPPFSLEPPPLLERVARLAATAAALGGPVAAGRHMSLAQELAAAAEADRTGDEALLRCSLLVLQLLAEEAEALDSVRRKALMSGSGGGAAGGGLASQRAGVVASVRGVMATATGSGAAAGAGHWGGGGSPSSVSFPLLLSALRCLSAWVRLDESGCADGGMSPGELQAMSPGLLPSTLGLLALPPPGPPASSPLAVTPAGRRQQQPAIALYAAVGDLAADLLGPGSRICTAAAGGEAADVAAAAAALEVLIATGPQLAATAAAEAAAEAGRGGGDAGAALAALMAWARVAVAVAERNADDLATGPRECAVQLANCVVAALVARPNRRELVETCTDYFLALNTVPTAERHPALAAPLYGALLPIIKRAVSYPANFEDWESEVEEDEEAFHRFREQQATDLLESIWGQCRIAMLAQLVAEATAALTGWTGVVGPGGGGGGGGGGSGGGADWRGVEAALFCLRAVHVPVKAAALGGRAGELDNPQAAATAAELQALLGRLFSDICSPSGAVAGLLHVPWVCLAVCRLIAEYAAWLGKGKDAPLLAAMDLLIRALAVPQAAAAAAQAFRNCCVRGAERLTGDPPALSALAAAAMTAVAPPPPPAGGGAGAAAASSSSAAVSLGLDERCAVVEGLSRLASSLPSDAAAAAGCGLMAPCAARAQAVVAAAAAAGGPLSPTTLAALAAELGLMTAVVRYLEPPGPPPRAHVGGLPVPGTSGPVAAAAGAAGGPLDHPALRALQVAWPVLSAVAGEPQCQTDPGVVEALAELYKRSLLSTKLAGRPLLPPLISAMMGVLQVRPHCAVLDCLSTVVELFGEVAHSGETRAAQIAALEGCVQMMAALMNHMQTSSSGPAPSPSFPSCSSPGELAASFFTLVDRYLIFARELLLGGEGVAALPALMDWACRILVTMREREPAAAALSFLGHLLSAAVQVATEEMTGAGSDGAGRPAAAAAAELRSRLDSLFGRYGPRLVQTLLTAGVDTCPLQLARALAGCLAGLTALADAGAAVAGAGARAAGAAPPPISPADSELRRGLPGWLRGAWQLPPLAELVHSGKLGDGGSLAALFTELLLRGHYPQDAATTTTTTTDQQQNQQNQQQQLLPPLTRGRLDSLVSDFFKLARGEADTDVMLAYQL